MTAPLLRIEGLGKSFGDRTVFSGVDLEVARGDRIAIIGASGSGKSTLLRCINVLERADQGRVVLGGEPVGEEVRRGDRTETRYSEAASSACASASAWCSSSSTSSPT